MTWSGLARSATSARRRCGRGSSRRCSTPLTFTGGRGSSRCRTSTACWPGRRSGRCSACSPTPASGPSRGAPWQRAGWPGPGGDRSTERAKTNPEVDQAGRPLVLDTDRAIVEAVGQIAQSRGVSMAQVALAWVLKNPVVSAPIVGATKTHHLADAVAALDLTLTDEEITALEAPYTPRLPTYFS